MESLLSHRRRWSVPRLRGRVQAVRRRKGHGRLLRVRAFTLVEMIAVIAIMAILAAIVVGLVVFAARKSAIANTEALLQRLSLAIDMYHSDWGDYPPDGRPGHWGDHWSFSDAYNIEELSISSEMLWFFLNGMFTVTVRPNSSKLAIDNTELARLPRKSPYMSFKENEVKHVGIMGLSWRSSDEEPLRDLDDFAKWRDYYPEIIDAWGYPLYYAAHDRQNKVEPLVNVDSYDLVSRGPDHKTYGIKYNLPDEEENRDNITNFSYD